MIPLKQGLTLLEALQAGGQMDFNNGSFIYEHKGKLYPHRMKKNAEGETHKVFLATDEGLYESLKFLQDE